MPGSLLLTERDCDILRALTRAIRLATVSQIAREWWSDCTAAEEAAKLRLRRLEHSGLLLRLRVTAIPIARLSAPLATWKPGEWLPDFGALAWLLKRRWSVSAKSRIVFLATAHAARQYGGRRSGNLARPFQISHDLGVSEMYFAVRRQRPQLAKLWVDEARLAPYRRGEKLPDAVVAAAPASVPDLVLEFGGAYGKQRLQDFHDDCEIRGLPYEIW